MSQQVGRNDPCPCGSGKKYKNCHAEKQSFGERRIGGMNIWLVLALAAGAIGVVTLVSMMNRGAFNRAPVTAQPFNAGPAEPAGQPWQYDSLSNRHFDPGHGHWHDGPPPPPDQRGAAAQGPTPGGPALPGTAPTLPGQPAGAQPAPWTYDAAKNQHWDPTHQHWHPGPPPQGSTP